MRADGDGHPVSGRCVSNELNEQVGRMFRSIPSEVEPIVVNLSLANMDFAEFADNTDPDGSFADSDSP
jgi:hypothetical protein